MGKVTISPDKINSAFVNEVSKFVKTMQITHSYAFFSSKEVRIFSMPLQKIPYFTYNKYSVEYLVYYDSNITQEDLERNIKTAMSLVIPENKKTKYYLVPVKDREFPAVIVKNEHPS